MTQKKTPHRGLHIAQVCIFDPYFRMCTCPWCFTHNAAYHRSIAVSPNHEQSPYQNILSFSVHVEVCCYFCGKSGTKNVTLRRKHQ